MYRKCSNNPILEDLGLGQGGRKKGAGKPDVLKDGSGFTWKCIIVQEKGLGEGSLTFVSFVHN